MPSAAPEPSPRSGVLVAPSGDPPAQGEKTKAKATGLVAWIMDEIIPIPGTDVKIGLDPLLGAFSAVGVPVGDAVTNSVSVVALVEALRRGLPFGAMVAIAGNILLNAGFGSVPVVGNIFSVFFRSNSRNRDIINGYLRQAVDRGEPASWWRVVPVVMFLGIFVVGALLVNMMLWVLLLKFLAEHSGGRLPPLKLP